MYDIWRSDTHFTGGAKHKFLHCRGCTCLFLCNIFSHHLHSQSQLVPVGPCLLALYSKFCPWVSTLLLCRAYHNHSSLKASSQETPSSSETHLASAVSLVFLFLTCSLLFKARFAQCWSQHWGGPWERLNSFLSAPPAAAAAQLWLSHLQQEPRKEVL